MGYNLLLAVGERQVIVDDSWLRDGRNFLGNLAQNHNLHHFQ